jgi:signal transduction histidine kinase
MREFVNFDRDFEKKLRFFFILFSSVGVIGNFLDIFTYRNDVHHPLLFFNLITITGLVINVSLFSFRIIKVKLAYIFTLYIILFSVTMGHYFTKDTDPDTNIFLIREALYVCFLITAAFFFVNETHGLITGIIFIIYFSVMSFSSKSSFLMMNLPSIVIMYASYIFILNFFYRMLRKSIEHVKETNKIIYEQNNELTNKNTELHESQQKVSVQYEELLTLSESIASQNNMLEKQNIKLEEAIQQKNKLFSIIAHDIKAPLFSLGSLTELILERFDKMDEQQKKLYLSKMLTSNKNLQVLLENLLTWSRSQTGLIEMTPEKINLKDEFDKIIEIHKTSASNKSLNIINEINKTLVLIGDRMMLDTVFRNIISNAIKYCFENGIITINANEQDNHLLIAVKDTGRGMNPEQLQALFTFEHHVVTSGTKGEKGTGLGLRICKEFIEKHGGIIWVESMEMVGTTIFIKLPIAA